MTRQPHLLFVDDERLLHNVFSRLFSRHNIRVTSCFNAPQAIEHLHQQHVDLVVTDFMMPDMDGLQLLAHIRQHHPRIKVIMITAHASVQHAVRSMKNGAIDYIPKPFSTTELLERVLTCLNAPERPAPNGSTLAAPGTEPSPLVYVGEHPSIQRLKAMLPLLSTNNAPLFIQGESGTGKEVLARLIHQMSHRRDRPFLALNCATLPRDLVESHLFGHRKGAFTDAIADMTGAFEQADGGTLLLDEITEIDLAVQAKLLRVLQEQEIQKVGASEPQRVDVRVIATSNGNVSRLIAQGRFREDLYHRLSVFPLVVPPLRDRRSDIGLLARHFAKKYGSLYGLGEKALSKELLGYFEGHRWRGNVRQLENMVQRGVLLSAERGVVELGDVVDDFFQDVSPEEEHGRLPGDIETLAEMERYMILEALTASQHNQEAASRRLGISSRTIRNKLQKYREEGLIA